MREVRGGADGSGIWMDPDRKLWTEEEEPPPERRGELGSQQQQQQVRVVRVGSISSSSSH